jgi:hypothetical protein
MEDRVQHRDPLRVVELADRDRRRSARTRPAPPCRPSAAAAPPVRAREALERDAGAGAAGAASGSNATWPTHGGLAVVVAQRRARLQRRQRALRVGEDAALGDHREVEALGDAGIDLDLAVDVLQRRDLRVEAAVQALRIGALGASQAACSGATMPP